MKKLLISLCLSLVSLAAMPQTLDPVEPDLLPDVLPTTPIKCLPGGLGSGTTPQINVHETGIAVGWWCTKVKTAPYAHIFVVNYKFITPALVMALKDVLLTTSRLSAMENVRVNFAKTNFYSLDLIDIWEPLIPAMVATKPL